MTQLYSILIIIMLVKTRLGKVCLNFIFIFFLFLENGLVLIENRIILWPCGKTFLCNGLSVSYVSHIVNAAGGLWLRIRLSLLRPAVMVFNFTCFIQVPQDRLFHNPMHFLPLAESKPLAILPIQHLRKNAHEEEYSALHPM